MFLLSIRKIEALVLIKLNIDTYTPQKYPILLTAILLPIVYVVEVIVQNFKRIRIFKGVTCMTYMFVLINYTIYDNDTMSLCDAYENLPIAVLSFGVALARTRTWIMTLIACIAGIISKLVFQHLKNDLIYERFMLDIIYLLAYAAFGSYFYVHEYNIRYNFYLAHRHELFKKSYYKMLQNLPLGLILLDSDNKAIVCNDEAQKILSSNLSLSHEKIEANLCASKPLDNGKASITDLLSNFVDKTTGASLKKAVEEWNSEMLEAATKYEYSKDGEEKVFTVKGLWGLFGTINCKILILQDQTPLYNLEALNTKYQKLYLASIVHDIRTPLNGIVGMLDMINLSEVLDENKKYLNSAKQMCKLMTFLTHDITDYSLIETNRFRSNISQVSLADTIHEVYDMYKFSFRKRELEYDIKIGKEVPETVFIDRNRYIQVLINLIGNALKYTFKGHVHVILSYDNSHDTLVTEIEDTGIGIKETDFPKLFKLFGKLDTNIEHFTPGVGFGLVICKRLIESMGGSISMESKEGVGSTFSFTIKANVPNMIEENNPCQPLLSELSSHSPNNKLCNYNTATIASVIKSNCLTNKKPIGSSQESSRQKLEDESISTTRAKSTAQIPLELNKCKCTQILLVDDNASNLLVLKHFIKSISLTADEALNGEEAIKRVEEKSKCNCCKLYKLIVMDINMPIMDGITATKRLRCKMKTGELLLTTIIALSAQPLREDEHQYFFDEVGFDNYLMKPIRKVDFLNEVKKYCRPTLNM
jgi:CheY-like chemotaxis protein